MMPWGANPFRHFGADLADVLSMGLSALELIRMDVDYHELVQNGMNERTERMFKFDEVEWSMLGKY